MFMYEDERSVWKPNNKPEKFCICMWEKDWNNREKKKKKHVAIDVNTKWLRHTVVVTYIPNIEYKNTTLFLCWNSLFKLLNLFFLSLLFTHPYKHYLLFCSLSTSLSPRAQHNKYLFDQYRRLSQHSFIKSIQMHTLTHL